MSAILSRIQGALKTAVTENRSIKVLALLISLGLFFAVRTQEKIERWVDVPVDAMLPDEESGFALTSAPVDQIRVYVRGRPSAVNELRHNQNLVVKMDLSKRRKPGSFTYFFDGEKLEFRDVEILEIRPDSVPVRLEKIMSRVVPVHVQTMGELDEHLRFTRQPKITPEQVAIRGAASLVEALSSVETDDVDISELRKGTVDVPVQLSLVDGIQFQRDGYVAHFEIEPILYQRAFTAAVMPPSDPSRVVTVVPTRVSVVLSGPHEVLEHVAKNSLSVQVGEMPTNMRLNGRPVQVPVQLVEVPADVTIVSIEPPTVGVSGAKAPAK